MPYAMNTTLGDSTATTTVTLVSLAGPSSSYASATHGVGPFIIGFAILNLAFAHNTTGSNLAKLYHVRTSPYSYLGDESIDVIF
jgi:hypothetical protein